MERLLLTRHAHSLSNDRDVVSSTPPGEGLSREGREQALALCEDLAAEQVELGIASRLRRAQETLTLGLGPKDVEQRILPELDDIHFGSYDGGPLADYRVWAWGSPPDAACPGGGESRVEAALRFARGARSARHDRCGHDPRRLPRAPRSVRPRGGRGALSRRPHRSSSAREPLRADPSPARRRSGNTAAVGACPAVRRCPGRGMSQPGGTGR